MRRFPRPFLPGNDTATKKTRGIPEADHKPRRPAEPGEYALAMHLRDAPRSMGWLPLTALVLSVLGLADSGYQVYTHFSGTGLLGCSASTDPCVLDQNSVYAWVFGIPVAVYGAAFFAFMVAICSPWAWRSRLSLIRPARTAAVVIGMLFVLYLIYREVISLGYICPYCTSVHVITFLLFVLLVYDAAGSGTARTVPAPEADGSRPRGRAPMARSE
jgi:uncharacterized membrane protein